MWIPNHEQIAIFIIQVANISNISLNHPAKHHITFLSNVHEFLYQISVSFDNISVLHFRSDNAHKNKK